MPYVHRMVQAGRTVEHRKMQSFRVHTKGVKRGPNKGTTTEKASPDQRAGGRRTPALGPERQL